MHQNRRRKKRPSYGVRTVEISRGKNGFGFTISGQAPCILSCIVTGSPAEKAGLRPGDFLIAVNGHNVSKAPHDDVVRLIGNSNGVLKLQIAENYYSDSSDEEFVAVTRPRPKYPHRLRRHHQFNVCRAEKVVQDLQSGALFVDLPGGSTPHPNQKRHSKDGGNLPIDVTLNMGSRANRPLLDLILQHRLRGSGSRSSGLIGSPVGDLGVKVISKIKQTPNSVKRKDQKFPKSQSHPDHLNISGVTKPFHSVFTEQELNNILYPAGSRQCDQEDKDDSSSSNIILRAVVGYLGTIEMPKEPQLQSCRLQAIRNCIRRLRIEKKVHTLVLLSVFSDSVVLTNPHGLTLAKFPAEKITFSGVYSDDKKFFGLVTTHNINEDIVEENRVSPSALSSSCHVFMVDPKLQPHHQHLKRAKAFHLSCTLNPVTNRCKEFPESAEPILQVITGLYKSRLGLNIDAAPGLVDIDAHISPQPSHTSSNSSNSDSGIGFRDEVGNASDRVLIVDVENFNRYRTNSLDRQTLSVPALSLTRPPLRMLPVSQENNSQTSSSQHQTNEGNKNSSPQNVPDDQSSRLTVRAMPDPVGFERANVSLNSERLDAQTNPSNIRLSMHKYMQQQNQGNFLVPQNYQTSGFSKSAVGNSQDKSEECIVKQKQILTGFPNTTSQHLANYKLSPKVYGLDPVTLVTNKSEIKQLCEGGDTKEPQVLSEITTVNLNEKTMLNVEDHKDCGDCKIYDRVVEGAEDGEESKAAKTSTQDENSSEDGCTKKVEYGLEATKKWVRTSSLRRHLGRKQSVRRKTHEAGTVSDGELATSKHSPAGSMLCLNQASDNSIKGSSSCSNSERGVDVGRVGGWAAGFNQLLEDPAGLYTFTEFLKKEFSQENMMFWIACEQYKKLGDKEKMKQMAKDIFKKHMCVGALEPVNVDSEARQVTADGLEQPTSNLFVAAQKQIFNLMKFDCYQRFLKSQLFKECMMCEMQGRPLLYEGQADSLFAEFGISDDKGNCKEKSKEDAEERRKKYLLPWHKSSKNKSSDNKKDGGKIVDRQSDLRKSSRRKKEKENIKAEDTSSTCSTNFTGSRSSVASSDFGMFCRPATSKESLNSVEVATFSSQFLEGCHLCRVILPDKSTTVIKTQPGETIGTMLRRLIERRGLGFSAADAFIVATGKAVDQNADVATLGYQELRMEQRILFCLDLPQKKVIGVKAKPGKTCGEVLKPILEKYHYNIEHIVLQLARTQKPVTSQMPISVLDNQRVLVQTKDDYKEWAPESGKIIPIAVRLQQSANTPEQEDVTKKAFEELLNQSSQLQFDDLGVVDLENQRSVENKVNPLPATIQLQSGFTEPKKLPSGLVRRNSFHLDHESQSSLKNKSKHNFGNRTSLHEAMGIKVQLPMLDHPISSQDGTKLERDDLFEVWNRAERGRLDDQRGTEINFELPDFLKVESNLLSKKKRLGQSLPAEQDLREIVKYRDHSKKNGRSHVPFARLEKDLDISPTLHFSDHSFSVDSIFPTSEQAEEYFGASLRCRPHLGFPGDMQSERFFCDWRIPPTSRQRPVPPLPGIPLVKLPPRPSSHPIPRFPPYQRPTTRSLPLCIEESSFRAPSISPATDMDDPLFKDNIETLDLDLDLDVNLKAQQSNDESLNRLKIPPPSVLTSTAIHLDKANYSPVKTAINDNNSDKKSFSPPPCHHSPTRRLSCEPPPLPPKAKARGPPPRPPSRQCPSMNAHCCQGSEEELTENDFRIPLATTTQSIANSRAEFNKVKNWAKRGLQHEKENSSAKCNISFV